jgi:monoamine oxidase
MGSSLGGDVTQAYDAIVVGAGFAGVFAARDLADSGLSVALVEGRPRIGGRAFTAPFADTTQEVEYGGMSYSPNLHTMVQAEVDRYGISVEAMQPVARRVSHFGDLVIEGNDTPEDLSFELERAYFHIMKAAQGIDASVPADLQRLEDLDVSWSEFVAPLELSEAAQDHFEMLLGAKGGRRADTGSALHMLHHVASNRHSAKMVFEGLKMTVFKGGTRGLLEAAVSGSDIDLRLSSPVSRIEQDDDQVVVRLRDGEALTARAGVVAVPMNCWGDIEFSPALTDALDRARRPSTGSPCAGRRRRSSGKAGRPARMG